MVNDDHHMVAIDLEAASPEAWADGLGAALLIGALAGPLPAIRGGRLSPTRAPRTL